MSQLKIDKTTLIGSGADGEVYCGKYGYLPVAIKVLHLIHLENEEKKQQFTSEVKFLM